eukprot:SAG31_NODE_1043_length_10184_cov_2.174517_2_plen_56_part_00
MIDLCNALDIEPIISLTRTQSPADMADFVECDKASTLDKASTYADQRTTSHLCRS